MALNTLSFAAMAVTISARFAYNSSFHPRIFFNNQLCWWSILIMGGLQVFITYTPVVNSKIFQMGPMDLFQWLIVLVFFFVTFSVMEAEKLIRRLAHDKGADTDDLEYGAFDNLNNEQEPLSADVAKDIKHLG